jgi:hypothetical protein
VGGQQSAGLRLHGCTREQSIDFLISGSLNDIGPCAHFYDNIRPKFTIQLIEEVD